MERYSEWSPTQFDHKGLGCESQQDWFVAPVCQTRDSGCLDRSNFRTVLRDLESTDPEGNDHEVHCFGHWGPGWFEIILVRPDSACAESAERWECALVDYPVASEEDFSELESEEAQRTWEQNGLRYRIEACVKSRVSIFAARRDDYPYECQDYLVGC